MQALVNRGAELRCLKMGPGPSLAGQAKLTLVSPWQNGSYLWARASTLGLSGVGLGVRHCLWPSLPPVEAVSPISLLLKRELRSLKWEQVCTELCEQRPDGLGTLGGPVSPKTRRPATRIVCRRLGNYKRSCSQAIQISLHNCFKTSLLGIVPCKGMLSLLNL